MRMPCERRGEQAMDERTSSEERETTLSRNVDNPSHRISSTSTSESTNNDVAKEKLAIEERLAAKMFSYEIICFFLAITFTAMAALHSTPPKVSKPPIAKPFFDQNSIVLDFYKGHLDAMIERITQADFSFVMYYAPWDAESQALRNEFESVAQFYHPQIFFAAINCWHPDSECRMQYNKIHGYPVLMLYPARESGINYRGIRTAPYMIHFLDALMNPIVRITHKEQLTELLIANDAVVIGYFNFTRLDKTPGYREFYKAAIRSLERDPNRELAFAIVTSASSSKLHFGVYKFPSANLVMWNESLSYPENNEWTAENILNWISSSIHQPSLWLQPPGVKALTFAPYLREGPVLFLFTPRNPLHTENYIYNLIRELGLQYYNCADNMLVKDIITRLENKRSTAMIRHLSRNQECAHLLNKTKIYTEQIKESITTISIQQWINNSCCANVAMNKCSLCKTKATNLLEKEIYRIKKFGDVCKDTDVFTSPNMIRQYEEQINNYNKNYMMMKLQEKSKSKRLHTDTKYKTSLLREENDSRSANTVKRNFLKESCKKWLAGNDYYPSLFPQDSSKKFNISLKELVCKTNKTLALIAIDSLHYYHFAEHLGIDISKRKNKSTVVILDAALESQYIMHHDFSEYTLINFINNYTQGLLGRTLRSNNLQHHKVQKLHNEKNNIDNNIDSYSKIRIPELTTKTFLDTILDPSKDVIVMYYSPYCGFCSAISYVYLTVAYYLSNMDHLIFVKIDGDNNDLPWEYSMNRFPSILFFPAKRKEDSTVFPFSVPITIPNLLNFVLANLNGDSHIEALINVCQAGTGEAPDKCITRIRWLCLDIIEQLLRDYRKLRRHLNFLDKKIARNKRKIILFKLEHIKDIHLILGSTIDFDRKKAQLIKRKFHKYYKVIRLLETDNKVERRHLNKSKNAVSTAKRELIRSEL
ncbi:thioredoxin domain-containing protein 11 isoform X1 [Cataglyphis hispanica]|uniref:thioredoxin domain-containing protein 11 isoform X1 n=1 Tax=Cataglyphis hispanica TaxID=1086592 RepID=UPI0021801F0F|nr:thioredoxin domain-containing protein 11 isoform X1 [Cataglyphis hispanica]XP_050461639.1 thioredoxin domain-containing protein 11 isoform X1 [Cataglyphis hispanica]